MRLIALDPSLTSTGIAVLDDTLQLSTHRVESAPPKRPRGARTVATLHERGARIRAIVDEIVHLHWADDAALVVVEGPSYASSGAGTWDRAGLWWQLVARLQRYGAPIAVVPPMVRAKWATGSGAAGKALVAASMARMWPALDAGISEDEWDAAALASIGAQHLGWMPVELGRHREQLVKVAWPELVSA